ncbi:efflux transporter, RND family, MFP subunit [Desulfotomaculum nigrificans CO-1-SRB]|uniref:Efflux transporter, RND family, MFP subunit n=1 Tax=Desulfotomaculum nigrificans (strain DSM 14880 / VKM B-2319 / CO-1-SRB) TaxID=868595 RepID=F6B6Y3_DESCC|nr:efflux RND transporter periplasmic adaptor subunit [Desulfotomaculum nigrificans]AEF93308.1 efflux transporter, RND family, MFP subunit [Desulfotomaculum nigrificans CO-1-SRB]
MKRVAGLSILLFLLVFSLVGCGAKPQQAEEKLVPVETTKAVRTNLTHILGTTGEIQAASDVAVAPKISGRVAAVHVKVGDHVSKGQVLFTLEATDLSNALRQAEAALAVNQANLEKAQRALTDAQLNYDRSKTLFDAQAISKVEFEQAESGLISAQAGLKMAQAQLQQSQVAISTARDNLSNATVTSPISGVVAAVNIDVGEMASPQVTSVTVVQLDSTKVKVNVSENVIDSIKTGTGVPVTIDALNKTITGTILSVSPKADPTTHAFAVEIELPNKQGEIKAGMVARLNLSTGTSQGVLAVPTDAVIERDGQYTLFLLENGRAKEVSVKVGVTSGDLTEIKAGLKEGQTVIVKGNRLVADGQKVKVVKELGGAAK